MLAAESYKRADLPEEFLPYEKRVRQLDVGSTGKTGALRISLERDPRTDRTVTKDLFSKVPLQVQKVLYPEESGMEMAYVYIMSPSGGILQGDRLDIDIRLEKKAKAHITTQAATKVYRMNSNYATQMVNLSVDDGCYLEFVPDQLIPYRNARFYQCVKMQVHENGTAVYSEIITPGRVASGEYFEYDICYFKTIATDQNSKLRFIDALLLEPKRQKLLDGFIIGRRSVFGNIYILSRDINPRALSDHLHNLLNETSVNGSASVLPGEDGVFGRMIADNANEMKNAIALILDKLRRDILGGQFRGTRKY